MPEQRMSRDERKHAISALRDWFRSQDIGPTNAAFIMATLIGHIASEINHDNRHAGLELLFIEIMMQAANAD